MPLDDLLFNALKHHLQALVAMLLLTYSPLNQSGSAKALAEVLAKASYEAPMLTRKPQGLLGKSQGSRGDHLVYICVLLLLPEQRP
jgi:hypothetical protein